LKERFLKSSKNKHSDSYEQRNRYSLVHRHKMKKWHWGIGNNLGVEDNDLQRALETMAVGIHAVSEEWCKAFPHSSDKKKMFDTFKDTAMPGDEIYIFCKGTIRAKGIFTGEIFPMSNTEWSVLAPSWGWTKQWIDTLPENSYKAAVESWEIFTSPLEGDGSYKSEVYEITPSSKNYYNYL
jgi:hypothetical protein